MKKRTRKSHVLMDVLVFGVLSILLGFSGMIFLEEQGQNKTVQRTLQPLQQETQALPSMAVEEIKEPVLSQDVGREEISIITLSGCMILLVYRIVRYERNENLLGK